MKTPLTLAEAQRRLLDGVARLPAETIRVEDASGRILARDLVARRTQPPADLSAMDGYALHDGGASSWQLVGESAAGHPYSKVLQAGEAIRISTGAILPEGTDCVLLQEDAAISGHRLTGAPEPGRHIRYAGFDFTTGQTLVKAGTLLGPAQIALALAAGYGQLDVTRKPQLAIIDSGDELAPSPEHCATHQIPASNGPMLAAMAAATLPCSVARLGPIPDKRAALVEALTHAQEADLIITSGGASVGDHDLIRPALEDWGAEIAFWRVAIKPGKPILVARRGHQLILGLPGNPVSSYVTAFLFMLPLLRAIGGASEVLPVELAAPVVTDLGATRGRMEFIRAHWDGDAISPIRQQDSSSLSSLAASNALIIRPADDAAISTGTSVSFYWLRNGGIA